MSDTLSTAQWREFEGRGYTRLGPVASPVELAALQGRIDEIMLGTADVDYDRMLMQLDRADGPDSRPGPQSKGHKGATLAYRKIQDLEYDKVFLDYLQKPLFHHICARIYGAASRVACYRAMFMNKPAGYGTDLKWHQDRWQNLDRDPLVTVWTALDDATLDNGCVHVIPASHGRLINPDSGSGHLTSEQVQEQVDQRDAVPLELAAGEGMLLHNWLLHTSADNCTQRPRRAFSVCYMDAATRDSAGLEYNVVFGAGALQLG